MSTKEYKIVDSVETLEEAIARVREAQKECFLPTLRNK